ncbi:Uncharacterised protein family (UPF0150) [Campylobacter jejuni subsp. doylei]|uniref:Type II toxin-antitoxin system HicB family antitoxin n=1 Tax=Campylobacter jejuni subsp. doylei TaxID=32021 RepID=A0A448J682_CAMJU|nr:Uncharacterised protein family (UPF0150) [Campylobacter jejuni subsp. doylei]
MKDLDYYLNLPYEIIIKKLDEKDGGGYFARYKDFPYIMGEGENEIKALKDVKEAFKGAIVNDLLYIFLKTLFMKKSQKKSQALKRLRFLSILSKHRI